MVPDYLSESEIRGDDIGLNIKQCIYQSKGNSGKHDNSKLFTSTDPEVRAYALRKLGKFIKAGTAVQKASGYKEKALAGRRKGGKKRERLFRPGTEDVRTKCQFCGFERLETSPEYSRKTGVFIAHNHTCDNCGPKKLFVPVEDIHFHRNTSTIRLPTVDAKWMKVNKKTERDYVGWDDGFGDEDEAEEDEDDGDLEFDPVDVALYNNVIINPAFASWVPAHDVPPIGTTYLYIDPNVNTTSTSVACDRTVFEQYKTALLSPFGRGRGTLDDECNLVGPYEGDRAAKEGKPTNAEGHGLVQNGSLTLETRMWEDFFNVDPGTTTPPDALQWYTWNEVYATRGIEPFGDTTTNGWPAPSQGVDNPALTATPQPTVLPGAEPVRPSELSQPTEQQSDPVVQPPTKQQPDPVVQLPTNAAANSNPDHPTHVVPTPKPGSNSAGPSIPRITTVPALILPDRQTLLAGAAPTTVSGRVISLDPQGLVHISPSSKIDQPAGSPPAQPTIRSLEQIARQGGIQLDDGKIAAFATTIEQGIPNVQSPEQQSASSPRTHQQSDAASNSGDQGSSASGESVAPGSGAGRVGQTVSGIGAWIMSGLSAKSGSDNVESASGAGGAGVNGGQNGGRARNSTVVPFTGTGAHGAGAAGGLLGLCLLVGLSGFVLGW
ncbi:hypothetical protein B9Z65_9145 [Elsinoe australis]|uniref:Uncharacterized protein n=1 Tax=Elsinoe australis TaxID=40998 RepID=A0A2P8ABW5_9PEZI|nr:hypothetical protein B9Z65_9145 [Elsinoe australis]